MKHSNETLDKAICTLLPNIKKMTDNGTSMAMVCQLAHTTRNELMEKAIVYRFLHPENYKTQESEEAFAVIKEHLLDFEESQQ